MNKKLQPTLIALSLAATFGTNAAVYKIENINEVFTIHGTIDGSRSGYGVVANSNSKYIGGASGRFAIQLTDEQEDAIVNSKLDVTLNATANATAAAIAYPVAKNKPVSSNFVFEFDQNFIPKLVEVVPEVISEAATATVKSYIFGINDSDILVGTTSSAAYTIADPDQTADNSSKDDPFYAYDFTQRGVIIDQGVPTTFSPANITYGGQSGFTAINGTGTIVGYASIGVNKSSQALIDKSCLETYKDTIPLAVCTGGFTHSNMKNAAAKFDIRAYRWEYVNGQLVNETLLGSLAQPIDDDDETVYTSIALDINDAGIAVGRSYAFRQGVKEVTSKINVAVVYKDGKIIDLMDHNNADWQHSHAVAINKGNLVVGAVTRNFSGYTRNKFFIHDASSDSTAIEFPLDFKTTETDFSSNANAINDSNIVVGNIEIDAIKAGTSRRTHGFYYDHNTKSFSDINDMLTCTSLGFETDGADKKKHSVEIQGGNGVTISYDIDITIVDVNDIANDGTILATALVKLPKVKTQWVNEAGDISDVPKTDYKEQVVFDANGQPVFAVDGSGKPVTEQLARAVVLKTTSDQACDLTGTGIIDEPFVRQGGNFGWAMLVLSLFGLGRRRVKNK
ncbi:MAG: DUF3466 family protein [Gammaproteobacteria bacterium]|nr:DUF3466 family protein [Gammaproteobacteria bacterium]